ncbi:MAG: chemotaxis protein CheW [Geobacteraceae bacterium]|nr:chemotaxis protein CheW [Geobacteraceae bacterium]
MNSDIREIQVACFSLKDDLYAVDIMRIKEIIRPQKLTPLPQAPPFVDGIINLRGAVIPVVDLRKRFNMEARDVSASTRLLIVKLSAQTMGLVVDDVTEVITVPVKDIKPPPALSEGAVINKLLGVCLAGENMVMLLDIDRLLTMNEVCSLESLA